MGKIFEKLVKTAKIQSKSNKKGWFRVWHTFRVRHTFRKYARLGKYAELGNMPDSEKYAKLGKLCARLGKVCQTRKNVKKSTIT